MFFLYLLKWGRFIIEDLLGECEKACELLAQAQRIQYVFRSYLN
jgi:hypothetical protein